MSNLDEDPFGGASKVESCDAGRLGGLDQSAMVVIM
jgi:hypothetical protein